jgi:hypothetical protein
MAALRKAMLDGRGQNSKSRGTNGPPGAVALGPKWGGRQSPQIKGGGFSNSNFGTDFESSPRLYFEGDTAQARKA